MTATCSSQLSASLEDYVEVIFRIVEEKQAVRARDIGRRLNVGRSSVTGALQALAQRELINYAPYDVITLTSKGREVARQVARRHDVLRTFFTKVLAVEPEQADAAACSMEHAISDDIIQRFVEFVAYVERCPSGGAQWSQTAGFYCARHKLDPTCNTCDEPAMSDTCSDHSTGMARS